MRRIGQYSCASPVLTGKCAHENVFPVQSYCFFLRKARRLVIFLFYINIFICNWIFNHGLCGYARMVLEKIFNHGLCGYARMVLDKIFARKDTKNNSLREHRSVASSIRLKASFQRPSNLHTYWLHQLFLVTRRDLRALSMVF